MLRACISPRPHPARRRSSRRLAHRCTCGLGHRGRGTGSLFRERTGLGVGRVVADLPQQAPADLRLLGTRRSRTRSATSTSRCVLPGGGARRPRPPPVRPHRRRCGRGGRRAPRRALRATRAGPRSPRPPPPPPSQRLPRSRPAGIRRRSAYRRGAAEPPREPRCAVGGLGVADEQRLPDAGPPGRKAGRSDRAPLDVAMLVDGAADLAAHRVDIGARLPLRRERRLLRRGRPFDELGQIIGSGHEHRWTRRSTSGRARRCRTTAALLRA